MTELQEEYELNELPAKAFTTIDIQHEINPHQVDEISEADALGFMRFLRERGLGEIYTQVDSGDENHPECMYTKGLCFTNRTGVYAFVFDTESKQ